MSDFETVPVGTMAELVRIQEDWERLREERAAMVEKIASLEKAIARQAGEASP